RWVVLLSGGYDRADQKGKFLIMLDAYAGEILWKASSSTYAEMKYSFPATPVFYANPSTTEPYIEGIVAADHGGQVWLIETPAQSLSGGRFSFVPKVVFSTQTSAERVSPGTDSVVSAGEYQRRPFFFAPTLTRHNGKIRVIIGSGDRDQLIPV